MKTTITTLKKLGFLLIPMLLGLKVFSQCTPDPSYTSTGIWPDTITNMAPACIGGPYQMDFTVVVPADTVVAGLLFIVDSTIVTSVSGLPAGFAYSCTPPSCVTLGGTSGCFIITGTPTAP